MRRLHLTLTLAAGLALSGPAGAGLIDRGGGLIYDTVLDITWLEDANFAQTSGFDADGRMTWANAVAWADGLSFFDSVRNVTWDDWRLPLTPQPDSSCSNQFNPGGSFPLQGFGTGCTGSEMGHLFNVDGITAAAPGLFTNVESDFYWSGSEFAPVPSVAWVFRFDHGNQDARLEGGEFFAWAVRPGDVAAAAVPEPGTVGLLVAGLGLLAFRRARRRR